MSNNLCCSGIILTPEDKVLLSVVEGRVRGLVILAGVCGGLAGVLGFAPFFFLTKTVQRRFAEEGSKAFRIALLMPLISFVLMAAAIAVCALIASPYLLVFSAVCVVVFLLATIVYTALRVKRQTR
jgi:hypothetical protein